MRALHRVVAALVALPAAAATAHGAIKLDNYTFDRFVLHSGLAVLAKFDKPFVHHQWEKQFAILGKLASKAQNFVLAEIPVKDYEDFANDDLRRRYNVSVEEYPAYILVQGSPEKGLKFEGVPDPAVRKPKQWKEEEDGEFHAPFITPKTAENLANWLQLHGVKIPSLGTIAPLDAVARRFMRKGYGDEELKEAKVLAEEYQADPKAQIYVRAMEKIKSKGVEYIDAEVNRVEKILAGDLSPAKAEGLNDKKRILNIFKLA